MSEVLRLSTKASHDYFVPRWAKKKAGQDALCQARELVEDKLDSFQDRQGLGVDFFQHF